MPRERFEALIKNNNVFNRVLTVFGLKNKGHNNRTLKERCKLEGIDISHYKGAGKGCSKEYYSLEQILEKVLVKNSVVTNTAQIKRYLLKYGFAKYECVCGNTGEWMGKKLALQLDHINGDRLDNRVENLRFLCPNCHSQTETFAGRSCRKEGWNKIKISEINPDWRKVPKHHARKVIRPEKDELEELVKTNSFVGLGRKFGVSDNAIRKWCRAYGIPTRKRDRA